MLTGWRRPRRVDGVRRGALRRGGLRRIGGVGTAVALGLCTLLLPAPARADQVRDAQQWVLDALDLPSAWQISEGSGVTVAVIDSGVNPDVSDLAGSVITGPDLTGVGTAPSNPDWGKHGTWMASLIAGHGHDGGGSGILGAAPRSRVLSIRVITDTGDPGAAKYRREPQQRVQRELAHAITYAVDHHASVISMSLGYGLPSRSVRAALQDAFNHNVVVVASAGNDGDLAQLRGNGTAPYSFPADYPGVLAVAAAHADGRAASFSSVNLSVQVAAPGVDVPAEGRDGKYWLVSGTSPACALVAGVAALIRSRYPGLTAAQIDSAITSTTTHRPSGGYDEQVGFGMVNAYRALKAAGRLGQPSGRQVTGAVLASSHFGGGPSAVPPSPVPPRGVGSLVWFCLLGVVCLAVLGLAIRVLMHGPGGSARRRPGGRRPAEVGRHAG